MPRSRKDEFVAAIKAGAEALIVGDPRGNVHLGPVVSESQWNKIQSYNQKGIDEGATLLTGGLGRPAGLERGYYVKPTVFIDVTNDMTIAREEIFGPVASVMTYETIDEAITIANDSPYGLAAYICGKDQTVISRIASGYIFSNKSLFELDLTAPFGGYKQSGNGREWGKYGIEEFLEIKSIVGK